MYRPTDNGIILNNCMLALDHNTLALFVGLYAQRRSTLDPVVEEGTTQDYTPLENGETPIWSP